VTVLATMNKILVGRAGSIFLRRRIRERMVHVVYGRGSDSKFAFVETYFTSARDSTKYSERIGV